MKSERVGERCERTAVAARYSIVMAALVAWASPVRMRGEDRVEYRYEDYVEDRDRMHIRTHSAYAESALTSRITARGQFVYDSISGASPTGGYLEPGSSEVPLNQFPIQDIRRAISLETPVRYGADNRQMTTPQFAYSAESDYESYGVALNHAMDFNLKNTTVTFGVARNFDKAKGIWQRTYLEKDTWDFLVGVNQVLGPNTHMTANFSVGYASGYLSDPYKGVNMRFEYPGALPEDAPTEANLAERRPDERLKQVLFLALTHHVSRLKGSIEVTDRVHHDDWGIWANTISLTWNQKIGDKLLLSPFFRWHRQGAADFYGTRFVGEPDYPNGVKVAYQDGGFVDFEGGPAYPEDPTGYDIIQIPAHSEHYSADYRLSELDTLSYGATLHWRLHEHFSIEFAYKRYEMFRANSETPVSAYPKAHVFTVGAGIWF